jgi:hypothetical protein
MTTEEFDDAVRRKVESVPTSFNEEEVDRVHAYVQANNKPFSFLRKSRGLILIALGGLLISTLTYIGYKQAEEQTQLVQQINEMQKELNDVQSKPKLLTKTDTIYITVNSNGEPIDHFRWNGARKSIGNTKNLTKDAENHIPYKENKGSENEINNIGKLQDPTLKNKTNNSPELSNSNLSSNRSYNSTFYKSVSNKNEDHTSSDGNRLEDNIEVLKLDQNQSIQSPNLQLTEDKGKKVGSSIIPTSSSLVSESITNKGTSQIENRNINSNILQNGSYSKSQNPDNVNSTPINSRSTIENSSFSSQNNEPLLSNDQNLRKDKNITENTIITTHVLEEQKVNRIVNGKKKEDSIRVADVEKKAFNDSSGSKSLASKKPFSLKNLQYQIGINTEIANSEYGIGILGEVFLNKRFSFNLGIKYLSIRNPNYNDGDKDDDREAGNKFRENYTPNLPDSCRFSNISISANAIQLPLAFTYYHPLKNDFALMLSAGTDLDIYVNQKVNYDYKDNSRTWGWGSTYEHENMNVTHAPVVFNNLTISPGIQKQFNHFVFQLSPFISPQVVQVEYKTSNIYYGLKLRVLYRF